MALAARPAERFESGGSVVGFWFGAGSGSYPRRRVTGSAGLPATGSTGRSWMVDRCTMTLRGVFGWSCRLLWKGRDEFPLLHANPSGMELTTLASRSEGSWGFAIRARTVARAIWASVCCKRCWECFQVCVALSRWAWARAAAVWASCNRLTVNPKPPAMRRYRQQQADAAEIDDSAWRHRRLICSR